MKIGNFTLATLALSGLLLFAGCGGGGGGGGGGSGIPTASNPAITSPPTTPVAINTGDPATNQTIAAAAFQAVDGTDQTTTFALGLLPVAVQSTGSTTETTRLNIANIVRRHAQKIKDHKLSGSVTGVQIVQTRQCFVDGTETTAFDDQSGNSSEIFVNCNDGGGVVLHGTLSSVINSFSGTVDNFTVNATFTIDLSITDATITPSEEFVTQGSMSFTVTFSGATLNIAITNASLLSSVGGVTEQLVNFNLTVVDDGAGNTSLTTGTPFSFASSAIGGVVTVNITTPVFFAISNVRPSSGVIEITGAPGKIRLTILGPNELDGVQIDVFTSAADTVPAVAPLLLTWSAFEALI